MWRVGGNQHIPRPAVWRLGDLPPWHGASAPLALDDLVGVVRERHVPPGPPPFPDARQSAVLVVLHDGDEGPEVLLTRRSMSLRNHRGEISFPGGRVDPGETAEQAARREAWEEVALDPRLVTVHGELDHLVTVVSQSYIVPVVASVSTRPSLTPSPDEVDRVLWVPLSELAHPATYREEWWGQPPAERPIHFFELADETIWGATARMLHQVMRLAHGVAGAEPPAW
jgi:mutator protein MutT